MRLLPDGGVAARLGRALPWQQVSTVVQDGRSGSQNGPLPALALVVPDAASNELPRLLPIMPAPPRTLAQRAPCSFVLLRAEA